MSEILYDSEQLRKEFAGSELEFIRMKISLALAFLDRADTRKVLKSVTETERMHKKRMMKQRPVWPVIPSKTRPNAKTRKVLSWY